MIGNKIKLEDIETWIPTNEKATSKITSSTSIRHSRIGHFSSKKYTYTFTLENDSDLLMLAEMSANPYFSAIPIYNMSKRINTGFIEKASRDWQTGASNFSITMQRGYHKFLFLQETIERPLHDRWKILISEDFVTDGIWPSNGALSGTWNSLGDGDQVQDIPWEEVTDDWATSTTADRFLSGTQSLECTGTDGIIVAGWDWWENYEISVWFYNDDAITDDTGIIFRYVDSTNHYRFMNTAASSIGLYDNATAILLDTSLTLVVDIWYNLKVIVQGHKMQFYLNGTKLFNGKDIIDTTYTSGRVGLWAALNNTHFDNFKVTLLPPTNFNLPASTDWTNQYSHADISTAHGTQKKLIAPDNNVQFKQSRAGEDCVGYWPMNEGQGDIVRDHSTQQNHGKINGATWTEDSEKGDCLSFDGTDDYIHIDIGGLLDSTEYFTIDFDIYIPSTATGNNYWLSLNRTNDDRFLWWGNADFRFYDDIDSMDATLYTYTYTNDTWFRVTNIFISSWIFSFINGQLLHIYENSIGDSIEDIDADYLTFGMDSSPGTVYGEMRIKNVRIFDTIRWDVAYGHDSTPATVFVHDDNRFDVDYPDDSDCVLLLHMDEGSGTDADITYDASGKGHDATLTDITGWGSTSFRGEAGTCLDFELANTDYLTVADHADFSFAGDVPFSIELWFNSETVGTEMALISKWQNAAGQREWLIQQLADNTIRCRLYDQNSTANTLQVLSTTTVSVSTWYYLVITYDGVDENGLSIYINGVDDTASQTENGTYPGMTNTTTAVLIGAYTTAGYFDGLIDEVRIHRKELSANEIAARYRSEPYLHDFYQATRVYDKSHQFKGLSIISNGLIMLSFPDYDTYERRAANVLMPTVHAWYENSWHLLGVFDIVTKLNGTEETMLSSADHTEWSIEELTDQYCKIKIKHYLTNDTQVPEGSLVSCSFIIKNGFPGILYEFDDHEFYKDDYTGIVWSPEYIWGIGQTPRFWYLPENNLEDTLVAAGGSETYAEQDDNWSIMFGSPDDSNAPSKNIIVGVFGDSIRADLGTRNAWYIGDSDDSWWRYWYSHNHNFGGIFFVPYDVDNLYSEGDIGSNADVTGTGSDVEAGHGIAGYTGDGYILCTDGAAVEYGTWNVGTLDKGTYMAITRVASNGVSQTGDFFIDDDADPPNGDITEVAITTNGVADTWEYKYLPFYTDGTLSVYLSIQSDVGEEIAIDHWICMPLANAINFPSDLAHMSFSETNLIRGLRK